MSDKIRSSTSSLPATRTPPADEPATSTKPSTLGTSTSASGAADANGVSGAGASAPAATPDAPATPKPDQFTSGGAVSNTGAVNSADPRRGLPDTLLQKTTEAGTPVRVQHGDDPGDFYCEHAFYLGQKTANEPGSAVVKNAQGERLVGFLHVPPDSHTNSEPLASIDPAQRHDGMREVVGSAMKGYFDEAAPRVAGDVRMLVTGYERFGSVRNNPTGDFVSNADNITEGLRRSFGDRLLSDQPELVDGALRYRVRDEAGAERRLLVQPKSMPVDDTAISGRDNSLQSAIRDFGPHAVLSMGVAYGTSFRAEFHADDGGLTQAAGGEPVHNDRQDPAINLPDNYSLARAIQRGSAPPPIPVSSLPRVPRM